MESRHEREAALHGLRAIGMDEAGYGCWAGSVFVGAVELPGDLDPRAMDWSRIRDSKRVPAGERDSLAVEIRTHAVRCGVGEATCKEIDRIGLARALDLAYERALDPWGSEMGEVALLVDGFRAPSVSERAARATTFVAGDRRVRCIAAGSILAKAAQCQAMDVLHGRYPQYGFGSHRGYGTPGHESSILAHGITPYHRQSIGRILQRDLFR